MKNCPLCRIVRGLEEACVLYEDPTVIAVLHCAPVTRGHTLLFPKQHYASATIVPHDTLAAMAVAAPKLAQALVRAVDAHGFNLHLANDDVAGQVFPHTHQHIIPRRADDGFAWNWRCLENAADDDDEIRAKVRRRLAED